MHDLAGGHPRIYLLFAHLLTLDSLDKLVAPFMQLLDELTPYYQSRMQLLSPQQRKIVEFLCSARGAVAVKEIATQNLLDSQTASGQLGKLEELGYVRKRAIGRESWYELREPLLRMVIELKRGRGEPVRLIVDFLRRWYSRMERRERLSSLSPEQTLTREYLMAALDLNLAVLDRPDMERAEKILDEAFQHINRKQFQQAPELFAEYIEQKGNQCDYKDWFAYSMLLRWAEQLEQSTTYLEQAICTAPSPSDLCEAIGSSFALSSDYTSALTLFFFALEYTPHSADILIKRAVVFFALDDRDREGFIGGIKQGRALAPSTWDIGQLMPLCYGFLRGHTDLARIVPTLFDFYVEQNAIRALQIGIVESILNISKQYITQLAADEWLSAWHSVAHLGTELDIPLRLLGAAVEWKRTQDVRVLMALPIEERRILERMLPNAPKGILS
ncbi:MAG: MarR family transcriptional regulator [Armatimonadetes bacterium]|nr:MarR family transcriptional regulator [Armatimonadota bacterium]